MAPVDSVIPASTAQTPNPVGAPAVTADAPAAVKQGSKFSLLILIVVFILLFGLALLLGYFIGFKQGQLA
jgi:hypothetical protein